MYLGLEVDVPHIQTQFPMYLTLEQINTLQLILTRLSLSMVFLSRKIQIS